MPTSITGQTLELIDTYFGKSEPGDRLHHLLLLVATGRTPLGLPDPDSTYISVLAMDPAPPQVEHPHDFVGRAIRAGVKDASGAGTIVGAVLTIEAHEAALVRGQEEEMRQMADDLRIHEHPDAVEVTKMYAACRDGRRWHGSQVLTGPHAGRIVGPHMLEGPARPTDRSLGPFGALVRNSVGIPW